MKYLIDLDDLSAPPAQMKIRVSRRGMLSAAADRAEERRRSRDGLPSFHIEDLSVFDDCRLAGIKPIVNSRAKITLDKDVVYAVTSASVDPIPLYDTASPVLFIFNQFNGERSIAEICEKTAEHFGWSDEKAVQIVRTVFLKLCEVRVCEPGNVE